MGYATEARDQRDISIAMNALLYRTTVGVNVETRADGCAYPVFPLSFYTFDDTVDEAAALLMPLCGPGGPAAGRCGIIYFSKI